jgi:hypothetical protein
LWCQPRGTTFRERIEAGQRDTSVSLYFRPQALERRARQNAFEMPEWIRVASVGSHFSYAIRPLTPRLTYLAKGLLQIPYQNGLRLLHAEAKSLELLCEIIHDLQSADPPNHAKDSELRRLDCAQDRGNRTQSWNERVEVDARVQRAIWRHTIQRKR